MASETTIMRPASRSAARPALLTHLVRTVRQQQLFVPGQHLIVAVSGGPTRSRCCLSSIAWPGPGVSR